MKRIFTTLFIFYCISTFAQQQNTTSGAQPLEVTYFGTSPTLFNTSKSIVKNKNADNSEPYIVPNKLSKTSANPVVTQAQPDAITQSQLNANSSKSPGIKQLFDGGSNNDNAAINGYFTAPPDTHGDVGPNHYVQMVNSVTTIFDKSGNTLLGPVPNSVFFQNLEPHVAGTNDGDPIALYDQFEDRWIISQFSVGNGAPYHILIAVSVTNDPTGAYHQYAISFGNDFPDYPKLGLWNEALYITTRDFDGDTSVFTGYSITAIKKTAMYNGQAAPAQRFKITDNDWDGIVPADADGLRPPPANEPHVCMYLSLSGTKLNTISTLVDFEHPENSSLVYGDIPVSPYQFSIKLLFQPNFQTLDPLQGFLMYRLQYRNFGSHASMVVNHTVQPNTTSPYGVRWYEFRKPNTNWEVYQQGTFAPTTMD